MTKEPPERVTISIPSDSPVDTEKLDELVEQSECESRSELVRELLSERSEIPDNADE